MNLDKVEILNPENDCDRFLTCVEEHHLIIDGAASQEAIDFYEAVGSKCAPCSRHFEELKSLRLLFQHNTVYTEPPESLKSRILEAIIKSP